MFSSLIYQSTALSRITDDINNKKINQIKHYEIITTQRSILINVFTMLLGMSNPLFVLRVTNSNTQQQYFQQTQQPIGLQHLSAQTLKVQLKKYLHIANQIMYIKFHSKRLYSFSNPLLRAFSEGVIILMGKIDKYFTIKLKEVQQEGGNILRNQAQYEQSMKHPITILSLEGQIKLYQKIISFIVTLLNKIGLPDSPTVEDQIRAAIMVLNQYYQECNRQFCHVNFDSSLHVVFSPIIRAYFDLCKQWLQMNEITLAMKVSSGFFIDLEAVVRVEEQRLFDLKNLVRDEWIPLLLKRSYKKLIELGKTIQFIKLYFGQEEKQGFKLYMNIDQQFQQLYLFLRQLGLKSASQYSCFTPKQIKFSNISQKLSKLTPPIIRKSTITQENPYQMHPQINGVFNLKPIYKQQPNMQTNKQIQLIAYKQALIQKQETNSINSRIMNHFDLIMERIRVKCMIILDKDRIRQSINRTLIGIKKFMFFQQGDFIQEFMEIAKDILNKPSQKISRNSIERLIEEAVRSSGAKNISTIIKQNISFVFMRGDQGGVKGWRIISIMYKPQRPTNCIFTSKVMEGYSSVSNLLFNLRHCEEVLVETWHEYLREGMAVIMKARNAVHHFVKALQAFLFVQIQAIWDGLKQQMKQSGSLLAVIQENESVLQKMKSLTVESKALCNCMLFLVKIVDRFQSIHRSLQQGREDGINDDLQQIWSWFLSIVDQSKQINNFSDTFDFRSDYRM